MKKIGPYSSFEDGINANSLWQGHAASTTIPQCQLSPMSYNLWFPTTKQEKEECFTYRSPKYHGKFGSEHAGSDYCRAGGTPVFAICPGVVEKNYTGHSDYSLKLLIVRHWYEDIIFWGHYGHISSSRNEGETVQGGSKIGEIVYMKGHSSHLHFGINVFKMYTIYPDKDSKGRKYGWGRTPVGISPDSVGWRDPGKVYVDPKTTLKTCIE